MKKIIALALSALLLIGAAVVGTVAFLTDTDQAVNVMTSGNIDIEQYEMQRDGDKLVPFVNTGLWPAFSAANTAWEKSSVALGDLGNFNMYVSDVKNVKDKIVYVENTGKNTAFVRTVFAFENTDGLDAKVVKNWANDKAVTPVDGVASIGGVAFKLYVYDHAPIAPGKTSASLLQVAFAEDVTNEMLANINGEYKILSFTQAVQTEGFEDSKTALNRVFKQITSETHPWTDVTAIACVGTAAELSKAVSKGGVVVLTDDIVADADATITVASGVKTTLLLNGHTISATSDVVGSNRNLFDVRGTMNVINGTIVFEHTGENMGWGSSTNIFNVTAGGVLNIENATLKNLGGSDMAFVAHLNNWGEVTLNVNNSTLVSSYVAVRVFNSGYDMNNVTITNSTLMGTSSSFWVHNYTEADFGTAEKKEAQAALLNFNFLAPKVDFENPSAANLNAAANNTFVGKIRYGFTNSVSPYKSTGVDNAVDLDTGTANGDIVILKQDLSFSASSTTANSGYGATGVKVENGAVLDGNGNTLKVNDAYTTWDCAIAATNGTIKNLTVSGAMRGIFMPGASGDVYIDNVIFKDVIYTFNSDGGNKNYGVYISNSTLNGWTSFSAVHKEVIFTNCSFGEGSGYAFCRPYNASVFENCVFEEGFEFDTTQTSEITFINCYYGETLITAENAATLGNGETTFFYNGLNGITIK